MGNSRILENNLNKEERMTHRYGVIFGVIVVAMLLFNGCSGDRGPAGPSGTTECLTCHADDSNIRAIDGQWRNSVHASGNNVNRDTPPCSGCHTSQGFMERVSSGVADTIQQPAVISCFTCHEPHTNRDFNLRTDAPVELIQGGTFNIGSGNLCANCHQARTPSPNLPAQGDTLRITSSHWGPHHGPQANIFSGQDAYVFPGAVYTSSPHPRVVSNGCPTCHMATPFGNVAGGHSMNMTYTSEGQDHDFTTGCDQVGCHTGLTDFNLNGLQDTVRVRLRELRDILITGGFLSPDTTSLTVNAPVTVNATQAGALYNYFLFSEDRSFGVHNTRYTLDALDASITAMTPSLASRP
jgi:hypothetical protein